MPIKLVTRSKRADSVQADARADTFICVFQPLTSCTIVTRILYARISYGNKGMTR